MKLWESATASWDPSAPRWSDGRMPCCATSSLAGSAPGSARQWPCGCWRTSSPKELSPRPATELACDYVVDLVKADDQIRQANRHIATAVKASGTATTKLFGVGPYVAATVWAEVGDMLPV